MTSRSALPADRLAEYLEFARAVAREAGAATLRHFRAGVAVDTKSDNTPVTIADRESEAQIRRRIAERFPDHGILGEEEGLRAGGGEFTWVVDPIDGTRSFVHGVPLYGVLIALLSGAYDGAAEIQTSRVLLGVLYAPGVDEMVSAARGLGCEWTVAGAARPACVSACGELSGSLVTTSDFAELARRAPQLHAHIVGSGAQARTWGDAFGYLLVATGRCEAMIDPIVSPWDIAPMPVIVEEAGGAFSTLDGRPVLGRSACASNGRVHGRLIAAH